MWDWRLTQSSISWEDRGHGKLKFGWVSPLWCYRACNKKISETAFETQDQLNVAELIKLENMDCEMQWQNHDTQNHRFTDQDENVEATFHCRSLQGFHWRTDELHTLLLFPQRESSPLLKQEGKKKNCASMYWIKYYMNLKQLHAWNQTWVSAGIQKNSREKTNRTGELYSKATAWKKLSNYLEYGITCKTFSLNITFQHE